MRWPEGSWWDKRHCRLKVRSDANQRIVDEGRSFICDAGYVEAVAVNAGLEPGSYTVELSGDGGASATYRFTVGRATAQHREAAASKENSRPTQRAAQDTPQSPTKNPNNKTASPGNSVFVTLPANLRASAELLKGTDVIFKSMLIERRAENLPVDPETFASLAPQTREFLLKQTSGITDLLLSTGELSCGGVHDPKRLPPEGFTVLVAIGEKNSPVAVGTRTRPNLVIALPSGVTFLNANTTQGAISRVRIDEIDTSKMTARGRLEVEGNAILRGDFVATYCPKS